MLIFTFFPFLLLRSSNLLTIFLFRAVPPIGHNTQFDIDSSIILNRQLPPEKRTLDTPSQNLIVPRGVLEKKKASDSRNHESDKEYF